ncbi:MAG TPA: hypothetical protein PKD52_08185 [Clostridiales bacterium]|nr:hypothetical protein [Clostridiales bacterium]
MSNCEKCGKEINQEDSYEYKDHLFCEICATMLQEHDFNKPEVMGCDGPVGTYKRR